MTSADVRAWTKSMEEAEARARWIGIATQAANETAAFPFSDSESSKWKAEAAQRAKANAKEGKDGRRRKAPAEQRLSIKPSNGGHQVVKTATGCGWMCVICRKRTVKKWRLTTNKCKGKEEKKWSKDEGEKEDGKKKHLLFKSGTVVWCGACGAFSETRADRLRVACRGSPPQQFGTGGVKSQLVRLRAGIHPVTKLRLPQTTWVDGRPLNVHGYSRRQARVEVDDKFIPYDARPMERASPQLCEPKRGGKSAEDKMRLLRGRIKYKELKAAREGRKKRKEERKHEVERLISSFVHDLDANGEGEGVDDLAVEARANDQDEAEFWSRLVDDARINKPDRFKAMQCKPSRLSRLAVRSTAHG